MPELERWVLHRLAELDALVRAARSRLSISTTMFTALHNFCAVDLSAFYFDIRKDRLYCDAPDDPRRRAVRTVLDRTFDCLVRWLAPVICFTAEEAWLARHGDAPGPQRPSRDSSPTSRRTGATTALGERWAALRDLRRVVTGAIELERGAKRLGSSLQAAVEVYLPDRLLRQLRWRRSRRVVHHLGRHGAVAGRRRKTPSPCRTSPDVGVRVSPAPGERCERCWRVLPEVGQVPGHPDLCRRCADVIDAQHRRGGERRVMLKLGLATAVVVAILDQLSKAAILGFFAGTRV